MRKKLPLIVLLLFFILAPLVVFFLIQLKNPTKLSTTVDLKTSGINVITTCKNGDVMYSTSPRIMDGGTTIQDKYGNGLRSTSEFGSNFGWMYYVRKLLGQEIGC